MNQNSTLPDKFREMASALPGLDASLFLAAMEEAPAVSIKLNSRKCGNVSETGYAPTEREENLDYTKEENHDVFMAIVDKVGILQIINE